MKFVIPFLAALALPVSAVAEITVIDEDAHFPEGPVVVDGSLYYVEYAAQTLMKWDGALSEVWRRDGCGPSAAVPFQEGFLITCYDSNEIVQVSMDGNTLAVITQDTEGNGFVGPNDFVPDGQGGAWMTASGPWTSEPIEGVVYHIGQDLATRRMADDLHYANGIAQIGTTLFVAESEASRIVAFDIGDDFSLSKRRLFVRIGQVDDVLGPWAFPDGIEVGPDGNLWVGSYSMGRIVVVTPEGKFVKAVEVPSPTAPNLTFGPNGEIYIMSVDQTDAAPYAGKVYKID